MQEDVGHVVKLPIDAIHEPVDAKPQVFCAEAEINTVLADLYNAVDEKNYVPRVATEEYPALSDDYVFTLEDQNFVLKDLKKENFVGKIKDLSAGARKREEKGLPQEYLYVFKYPCKLMKKYEEAGGTKDENVLIYIKINDRKVPYKKMFVISFHKNKPRD